MTSRFPLSLVLGMAAVAGAWRTPCASAQDVEAERDLGRKVAFAAQARLPLLRDPEITGPVRRVGERIVAALGEQPFDYHFFVLRDPQMNAFAVPGGYVFVHSGLLARVQNEDELAGVLGHEIAHVDAHHLLRQQQATGWLDYASLLGILASMVDPALGAVALGASASVQLQYRREFEEEADRLGLRYMRQAGFEPRGMLDFFQQLREEEARRPTHVPPYLLTHPLSSQRIGELELALRALQWTAKPSAPPSPALGRARLLARMRSQPARDVLPAYQEKVAAEPGDPEARYLLAVALLESGNYEAARQTLEQARTLGHLGVDREIGRAFLRSRQPAEARVYLARAAERDPADPVAQLEHGRALEALGEEAAAMAAYRRALALDADLEDAQRQLGLLTGRAGAVGEGHFHLAKAHMLRGEYPQALSQFEKASETLPPGDQLVEVKELLFPLRDYVGE